ncbi:hypothetical protein [Ovoidimarina sediminis]|uniref:hypothetical protein n=1 Tax=Ovoidimarina sediminis TaxID=3079856 RepID=UPI002908CCCA|nr:hypothetical protein [Rhodophyticola sp. MJ-SS7]MDU8945712.1 hypothetical protein [Rhodophyticola sp. MJ-SS7]
MAMAQTAQTGPMVTETYWGYTIRDPEDRFDSETLVEIMLRFLGLILVMSAYGQWLLPASIFPGDAFLTKACLAFVFGAGGVAIYYYGSRGLQTEVHIDLARRELRLSRRNCRGQSRLKHVVPMAKVESAYLKRDEGVPGKAHLFLRFAGRRQPVEVANGRETDLTVLLRRLSVDLRPMHERVDHKLAKSALFQSSRLA